MVEINIMKLSSNAKNAIYIGSLCSVSYLAVYIARNTLGAVTNGMIADGYDKPYIADISFFFLMCYVFGQLINGIIGDKIKAKWMICLGLFGAGLTNVVFTLVIDVPFAANIVYGLTGFFLSMIYGPMTKIVSENTEPIYTTRCTLGYTFSSLIATPSANILSAFLVWQGVFGVTSALLVLMAFLAFLFFSSFERRGIITYGRYKPQAKGVGNFKSLFKRGIVKMTFISIITGVIRTSAIFWLPTYISEYLKFNKSDASLITAAATFVISLTAFIAVFVYEKLGYRVNLTMFVFFIASCVFFVLTYLVKLPMLNIIFIVLAIMASIAAANMIWSRYCPSLRDTGMVSSATGFLDFVSYMAAAFANVVFANAAETLGWGNLILVWFGLMVLGIIICIPRKNDPIEPPSPI